MLVRHGIPVVNTLTCHTRISVHFLLGCLLNVRQLTPVFQIRPLSNVNNVLGENSTRRSYDNEHLLKPQHAILDRSTSGDPA